MDPKWKFPTFEVVDPENDAPAPVPTGDAGSDPAPLPAVIRKTEPEMAAMVGDLAKHLRLLVSWVVHPTKAPVDMPSYQPYKPRAPSTKEPQLVSKGSKTVIGAELLGKPKDASKAYMGQAVHAVAAAGAQAAVPTAAKPTTQPATQPLSKPVPPMQAPPAKPPTAATPKPAAPAGTKVLDQPCACCVLHHTQVPAGERRHQLAAAGV